jgi:serine/threonine-protein kinase
MATVYLARDLKHERPVALKVLHFELARALGPERFLREVRTTARLQHPHILPVLDSGDAAEQLWYTMPYVRGESLRERLRREAQLPMDVAVNLARQVALALDYAHREGVVHRDLKPENILLSEDQALVADFGLAKAIAAGGESQLTETGMSVGTPAYMSPEQASAGQVDARSDIYALGCVLYEMLAGEPPFTGSTPQAILAKRVLEPVPHVRTLRDSVPEPLEQAITRALAKAPADRFASAAEFAQALAGSAVSPSGAVRTAAPAAGAAATATAPSMPIRRRRVPALVTALGLGLLLGLGVLLGWLRTRPEARTAGPKRLAVLPFENLGRPEDGYFADGVTDEVRGKLAALPGLEVIARTSSAQYKQTTKGPQQIGRELRVDYLLTGTVRWEKDTGGASRVRVSPELVQVSTASTKWQAPFEAPLTDVFRVQADVAARVAEALGLALGSGQREQLAERPTENLAAYDAYLRALDLRRTDAPAAAAELERAIALDSAFALAWAELALTRQYFHSVGFTPQEQIERSRREAERALAMQPKQPLAYYALGQYYARRLEYGRALAEYARGLAVTPNDARLLEGVVRMDLRRGQWERALEGARRVEPLDPRSTEPLWDAAMALTHLRRFPEALAVVDRALVLDSLSPGWYPARLDILGAQGDSAGVRRTVDLAERRLGYSQAVAYLGRYLIHQWMLPDTARAFLLRVRPSAMEGDTIDWAFTLALAARSLGQVSKARAYADTAGRLLEARQAEHREADTSVDYQLRSGLCLASALAGWRGEARRHCEALLEQPNPDAMWRDVDLWGYARAAVELGDIDGAVSTLEQLVREPGRFTPAWLKIDPNFAPLRGNPRFERLVAGK